MAIKKRGTSRDLWKKKTWYEIVAPRLFDEVVVGETPALDKGLVVGRTVEVIANEVGGGSRNAKLIFKVVSVEGSKAKTELSGMETMRSYLRSATRRRSTKVGSVLDLETKDKKKVRVKLVTFTARRCTENQRAAVKAKVDELISAAVNERTFEALIKDVLEGGVQKSVKEATKTVYPLKQVVFSSIMLL